MKIKLCTLFFCLCAMFIHAQTVTPVVLSNNGGATQTPGGGIEWTIGEPVSDTYTSFSNITTMGFHQPKLDIRTLITEQGGNAEGLLVFPNPVRDELNISFSGMTYGKYTVRLSDAAGKIILESGTEVSAGNHTLAIKVNEVAAGNYFLTISGQEFDRTVKINKVY